MVDKILQFFSDNEFQNIKTNIQHLFLYYQLHSGKANVFVIIDNENGEYFTKEMLSHILEKLKSMLYAQSEHVEILGIICMSHPEDGKMLMQAFDEDSDSNYWIVDLAQKRLIIYENQKLEFNWLRKELDELLYSGIVRKKKRHEYITFCNTGIILLNVIIFFYLEFTGGTDNLPFMLKHGALFGQFVIEKGQYYRLLTSIFLHFGFEHLLNNMVILAFIGSQFERSVTRSCYLIIYFGSGIIAGIVSMGYNFLIGQPVISAGASGAIFGVVGAMVYILIVNKGRMQNLSTRQLLIFAFFSLYGGLTSRSVDNAAHIGGFIAGFILSMIFYRKPRREDVQNEG